MLIPFLIMLLHSDVVGIDSLFFCDELAPVGILGLFVCYPREIVLGVYRAAEPVVIGLTVIDKRCYELILLIARYDSKVTADALAVFLCFLP